MKKKAKVRLGGMTWKLKRARKMRGTQEGECDTKRSKITYEKNKHHHEQDNLLHEILHAVIYVSGARRFIKKEEELVCALTPHLNGLIKWKIRKRNIKR